MFDKFFVWLKERRQKKAWDSWSEYWLKRMLFENQELELTSLRIAQSQFRQMMKIQKRFKKSKGKNDYVV